MSPPSPFSEGFRIFALAASAVFLVGCEKPQLAFTEPSAETESVQVRAVTPVSFPVDRSLTDQSGRVLKATIVGRTNTQIFIIRKSDGMRSTVPFSKLSSADLAYAASLPLENAPSYFFQRGKTKPQAAPDDRHELYIETRKKSIDRLTQDNLELGSQMSAASNQILIRSNRSKIQKNEEEIVRLQGDIYRVQSQGQ